ncbi:hypothetical protein CsSME_00005196 [Camellia sinensis var. sinensis]
MEINTLRQQAKSEKHRMTYFLGFFSGCSIALVVAIIVRIHARDIFMVRTWAVYGKYISTLQLVWIH